MAVSRQSTDADQEARYVSARKRRGRGKAKIQPPLVPMIDVTFQLLLYFLLTAEFRMAEGQIAGTVPETGEIKAPVSVDVLPIRIAIRRGWQQGQGASYEIGGVAITSAQELYFRLMGLKKGGGEKVPVIIEPLADVPWEFVLEAYNQAVRAKFLTVSFAPGG